MLCATMPERVRVYLMEDYGAKAVAGGRDRVSKRFITDSLRDYLESNDHEIPEDSLNELVFSFGSHGKPFFADPMLKGLYFSLSHTKGIAVCAVADKEIGCDIERPGARRMDSESAIKIAKRYFAHEEYEMLLSDPVGSFFPIWTKKEAYVKWTGRGFAEGFSSFSVFSLPEHIVCESLKLAGAGDAECAICFGREM